MTSGSGRSKKRAERGICGKLTRIRELSLNLLVTRSDEAGEGAAKVEPPTRDGTRAPPSNGKPPPGKEKELDDIIDELEEDREGAPKG